jgi:ribosomal-protein-alanine N-acetyltransferase
MAERDLDQVALLEQKNFSRPWSRKSFLEMLSSGDALFLVAVPEEDTDRILGYCGLLQSLDTGDITNVSVDPEQRGKRIGTFLLEELICRSTQLGVRKIFLEVRRGNAPANRLYEAHGFRQVGIRKQYYADPVEDARVLCRDEEEEN